MLPPQRMYLLKPEGKDWIHMVVQRQYLPTEHIIKGLLVNLIGSASSDSGGYMRHFYFDY